QPSPLFPGGVFRGHCLPVVPGSCQRSWPDAESVALSLTPIRRATMCPMPTCRRPRRTAALRRFRPQLLLLEDRLVPSVMTDGPLVGGVTNQARKAWARTDVAASVVVEYGTDPLLTSPLRSAAVTTSAASDFTAIVSLTGLQDLTKYYYRILVDGAPQETTNFPSFTTFANPGLATGFSFAIVGDLENARTYPDRPAPAYIPLHNDNPAFVLQIGDFDHRNPVTLAAMRLMHQQVRGSQSAAGRDWQTYIGNSIPVDHVYDDHDYGINDGDKTWAQKAAALQSYKEYYPTYD